MSAGAPAAAPRGARTFGALLRTAAWLGWQIESNWADPFVFVVYAVMRPLATAFILAGMYWAVSGQATKRDAFQLFFLGNAFHIYVTQVLVGMGWLVVLAGKPLFVALSGPTLAWLFAGGAAYSLGTVFYLLRREWAHPVWHGFVLAGSACHFVAVSMQVLEKAS